MRMTTIALSAIATLASTTAYAGGYVVPIIEAVPQVVATSNTGPSPWLAAIPIALLLLFKSNGGDHATLPPGGHGGPCFREDTMIMTESGWRAITSLSENDMIVTTKGPQAILHIASWVPVELKDRGVVINHVVVSKNHCVLDPTSQRRVPAIMHGPSDRVSIDGSRFFHILLKDHAWIFARNVTSDLTLIAESMFLTMDMKPLCDEFFDIVQHHAAHPCDETSIWTEFGGLPDMTTDPQLA